MAGTFFGTDAFQEILGGVQSIGDTIREGFGFANDIRRERAETDRIVSGGAEPFSFDRTGGAIQTTGGRTALNVSVPTILLIGGAGLVAFALLRK